MRRARVLAPLLLAVLLLPACSDDEQTVGPAAGGQATSSASKPVVEIPDGAPPKELQVTDITMGTGAAAKNGDRLTVHYVGVSWSTKEEFDASWGRGEPFPLVLGSGQVIQGWDKGLVGMKAGGRRRLVIPPDLGYGASGSGPIKPNETLVFVVDLVSIQPG